MAFVAKKIFLTKGVGKHRERLSSFELALRNAGIAACNIVRVSSIFPPNCKLISRSEGLKHLRPGQVAFTVISENSTKEAHRLIAASIGLALPSDKSMYGYLSEHHSFGETEEVAGEYAEELAAEMLATTLNVVFTEPSHTVWAATGCVVIAGGLFTLSVDAVLVAPGVHVPLTTTSYVLPLIPAVTPVNTKVADVAPP